MPQDRASLRPYHLHFLWVYVVIVLCVSVGMVALEFLIGRELDAGSWLGVAVLLGAASATAHRFVTREQRVPTRAERWRLVGAGLAISMGVGLALMLVLGLLFFGSDLGILIADTLGTLSGPLVIAAVIIMAVVLLTCMGFLHLAYGWLANRMLKAEQDRLAKQAHRG